MNIKGYLIDLDGTLYSGEKPIFGAAQFIDYLNQQAIPYLLTTNCPSRSQQEVAQKLFKMNIHVTSDAVLTSGMTAASYIKGKGYKQVFLVGEKAAQNELETVGLKCTQSNADCVLVSWDRQFSYAALNNAMYALDNGAELICTNSDNVISYNDGFVAHTGAICAAIETAAGRKATYIGKPERFMAQHAAKKLGIEQNNLCVVGDRLDTDIAFAKHNGMQSVLTLTGCTKAKQCAGEIVPDVIVNNLVEYLKALQ